MITVAGILYFLGVWSFSIASRRAVTFLPRFLVFLKGKRILLNSMGWILVLGAYAILIFFQGLGKGIIYGSILWMAITSLVILLQPLRIISYTTAFLILSGGMLLILIS